MNRSNNQQLYSLINATHESVIMITHQWQILVINQAAADYLHHSPQQLVGKKLIDCLHHTYANVLDKAFRQVLTCAEPVVVKTEQEGVHTTNSIYPVCNASGEVDRLAIFIRDITEQHRLEATDRLLNSIDRHVLHADSLEQLLTSVCQELVEQLDYRLAWVARKEIGGNISIVSLFSLTSGCSNQIENANIRWDNPSKDACPTGTAIRIGQEQQCNVCKQKLSQQHCPGGEFKLASALAIPLVIKGEVYGALTLYSHNPDMFDNPNERARIDHIATRLRIASEITRDHQRLHLLGTALATTSNGAFITDRDGRIVWVNDAFCHQSGYLEQQLIGQTPRILKSGFHDDNYYRALWKNITSGNCWHAETVERHRNRHHYTVSQTITPIHDEQGKISHFVAIHEDISKQKETQKRIEYLAHHDILTQLPNRALFYDRLKQAITVSRRSGDKFALMFLDLDHFKQVNDKYGHALGDLLLQAVAKRLTTTLRASETVARLGGDEFTILLPGIKAKREAIMVGKKIIHALGKNFTLDKHKITSGVSIGIAIYPDHGRDDNQLTSAADSAMYHAKRHHGSAIAFASESPDRVKTTFPIGCCCSRYWCA